jgi:hypothetical protein
MEMLGLLSLIGQRVPEAAAELLSEMRSLAKATADYHVQLDERLAELPKQISAEVDVGEMAKAMSEAFRQQLSNVGLRETASLLNSSAAEIKARRQAQLPFRRRRQRTARGEIFDDASGTH